MGVGYYFAGLLGIILLLDNLKRDLNEQWFSQSFKTRISLLYHPKSSSVEHILDMSSLVIFSPTASFSTFSKLVGIWDGILFVVRSSSLASRLLSRPKNRIFQVSYQEAYIV